MSEQKLTGFNRFVLTKLWRKLYMEEYPDKEEYIQAVCKAKGLEYTPPIEIRRDITMSAKMFPVKEK